MLIALFALAHLPIFRKPLQSLSRCGKGKSNTTIATTTTTSNAHLAALTSNCNSQTTGDIILIGTRLNMSNSNEQDKGAAEAVGAIVAANGNQTDPKKIEIMYVDRI